MSAYNLVRSQRNFTKFIFFNAERIALVMPFRLCRYLHHFQRYLRSNSKVVVNRTDFWTFFALPNFKGAVPQNLCLRQHPNIETRPVPKFRRATPPKPIFDPPLKKTCKGAPVPAGGCASNTWSFSSACEIWGRSTPWCRNMVFQVMRLRVGQY